MKKNFLVLALVILSFGAYSQKIEIQNASNYSRNKEIDKAVDCIERATTNEETKNDCKAWYLKGKILLQLDDMYSMVKIAREGMTEKEVLIKEMSTEVFIASANALAMTGEIVNIDGRGNRITSLIYGHDKVYYIIGRNKIVPTLDDAVKRAKYYAAPLTAQRLGVNTPCAAEGKKCYDCNSPDRICNTMTITWRPSMYLDVELLLIDEDLGY